MTTNEILDDPIVSMLWGPGVDSTNRLALMLKALFLHEGDAFWRVFANIWSTCDHTWDHQEALLSALEDAGPGWTNAISPENAAWFAALPGALTIYRGCSLGRLLGASWTLDKGTAVGFARGHRSIPVTDPVVATARISKKAVLFASNDRQEVEVLVDPYWIKRISFQPMWTIRASQAG